MKKRGFGEGLWNGFGGKVEKGESIEEAARRELTEEAGIEVQDMEKRADLLFVYEEKGVQHQVHVFSVTEFSGEPVETAEMKPKWFAVADIPYDDMWPDDKVWLPKLLAGEVFSGEFVFGEGNEIVRYQLW